MFALFLISKAACGGGDSAEESALLKEAKRQQKTAQLASQRGDTVGSRLAQRQALETEIRYETVKEQRLTAAGKAGEAEQCRQRATQLQQQLTAYDDSQ